MKSLIVRATWYALGVVAMVLAMHGQAQAGEAAAAVPEINASTLSAGFGLLAAGVMIVRSRMKAK
jgi:hypothetical protein